VPAINLYLIGWPILGTYTNTIHHDDFKGEKMRATLNESGDLVLIIEVVYSVGGGLDLRGTGITALPDNLSVGGDLDLRGTGITALPDNLSVGGDLY
jgi:hypothetical protein